MKSESFSSSVIVFMQLPRTFRKLRYFQDKLGHILPLWSQSFFYDNLGQFPQLPSLCDNHAYVLVHLILFKLCSGNDVIPVGFFRFLICCIVSRALLTELNRLRKVSLENERRKTNEMKSIGTQTGTCLKWLVNWGILHC